MENNKSYEIKKTGTEKTYGAATRCSKEGKGRFDLIPEYVLSECFKSYSHQSYAMFPEAKAFECALNSDYVNAVTYITQSKYHECDDNTSSFISEFVNMVRDLAIHFQKGAEMYGERNCEKGIPLWSFRDSGIRHLTQYINGETDEPHHISAIWNFVMAEWTIIHHPERCDKAGLSSNDNDDKKVDDCDNSTIETSTTYNGTPLSEFPSLIKEYEDNHSTKTSNESNDYCGLEHEIRESLKELGCDDNEMNGNILVLYNNKSDDPIKIEYNHKDNMYTCKNVDNVIKIHNMGSQNASIDIPSFDKINNESSSRDFLDHVCYGLKHVELMNKDEPNFDWNDDDKELFKECKSMFENDIVTRHIRIPESPWDNVKPDDLLSWNSILNNIKNGKSIEKEKDCCGNNTSLVSSINTLRLMHNLFVTSLLLFIPTGVKIVNDEQESEYTTEISLPKTPFSKDPKHDKCILLVIKSTIINGEYSVYIWDRIKSESIDITLRHIDGALSTNCKKYGVVENSHTILNEFYNGFINQDFIKNESHEKDIG